MADITQRLGFDVSQGVSALNTLKSSVDGLTRSLTTLNNVKLGNVGRSINRFTKNLDKVPGSAGNAVASIQKLGQSVGLGQAAQNTGKLNQQLEGVGATAERVGNQVRTTIGGAFIFSRATSALRQIQQLLLDAADSANEFQLQVAEVQTIAGGAEFDELAASIRAVSLEFGGPDAKVAEAAYQAFSNQVVQTTGELNTFLPVVEKLRTATGSDAADAVNALSSVLNTYGDAAGNASQISDVLFKTVELGRTRFSEFANSLGTINSLAIEAGVSFTEVQAGIADITKTGTTTSVALTQLRGIFTKLVKPTDQLRQAFASFGAEDGPAFVKASGGLLQALQRLQQFSDETGVSLVELFGRVRGGQGALNILRNEGQGFLSTLGELTDASNSFGDVTEEAFSKVADTDAFGANKAFNELNSRITELGDSILPVIGKFTELFNKVAPDTQTLGILIAGASAALLVLAAAGATAVLSLTGIAAFLLPIAPLVLAIVAATGLLVIGLNAQNAAIQRSIDLRTKDARAAKEAADAQVKETGEVVKAIESNIQLVDGIIEQFFGDQLEDLRAFNEASVASFNGVIDAFGESRKNVLKQIESFIKNADSAIDSSNKRAQSALQELADIKFDESIEGLDASTKATRLLERASKTASLARKQFAEAGQDAEKQREALDTRALAREQLTAAERAANATASEADDKRAGDARKKFLRDISRDENKFSTDTKKLQDEAKAKIDAVTQSFKDQGIEIDETAGKLSDLLSIYDGFGDVKTEVQIFEDLKAAVPEAERLRELLSSDFTGGLAEQVGAGDDLAAGQQAAFAGVLEFGTRSAESILSARNIIESEVFRVKIEQQGRLEDVQVRLQTDQAEAQIAGLKETLETQIANLNSRIVITPEIDAGGVTSGIAKVSGSLLEAVAGAQAAFLQSIRAATEDAGTFTQAQVNDAQAKLDRAKVILDDAVQKGNVTTAEAAAIDRDLEAGTKILEGQSAILEAQTAAAKGSIADATQEVTNAKAQTAELATETGKVATSAGTIKTASAPIAGQVSAAVGPMNSFASAAERAARATQQISAPGAGTAFFGKTIHRQTGGFTRGQDRILTSTAPGEVVINANAARGIRSELQAINAQQTPQFRETGGAVTNVGDINVNISTQDPGSIEGRPIARDLKRELRTRTSSL